MEQTKPTLTRDKLRRNDNAWIEYDVPGFGAVRLLYCFDYNIDYEAGKLDPAKLSIKARTPIAYAIASLGFEVCILPNPERFPYPTADIPKVVRTIESAVPIAETIQALIDRHFPKDRRKDD